MTLTSASATSTATAPRPKPRLWFGRPVSPGKVPLKANVFETMVDHQGMLQQKPMFPYLGPGDLLRRPRLCLGTPSAGMPRVHFFHYNDIQEVVLCMAGQAGLISTGAAVLAAGTTHGVTSFLEKAPGADRAVVSEISLIIIRMKTEGPQMEGFIIRCLKCNEVVYRLDRDIFEGPDYQHYGELANIRFYADAGRALQHHRAGLSQPPTPSSPQEFPVDPRAGGAMRSMPSWPTWARTDIEAAATSARGSA